MSEACRVAVLCGGVGGVKLVDGLYRARFNDGGPRVPELTVVANTGDDFWHWGLRICPDLDTIMYTLAGLSDDERGWGRADETFACRDAVGKLGGDVWFNVGDRDLATHLLRAERLRAGESLTDVTIALNRALGVAATVLPMADEPRPTFIDTADGRRLPFQRWLVQERAPAVVAVHYDGTEKPTEAAVAAISRADLVVIAPSNPYVSINPILTLQGVRDCVAAKPVVAVSPIVAGAAVKGPLAAMLGELDDVEPSAAAVAGLYGDLVDCWVVETGDTFGRSGVEVVESATVMRTPQDRIALAEVVLQAGHRLLGT